MRVSSGPIGVPARSSFERTDAYTIASSDVNSSKVIGERKFSTRLIVFAGDELFAAPVRSFRFGVDADSNFFARLGKQPIKNTFVVLQRADAGVGVENKLVATM
jgi:hypothetical protein